MSEQTTRPADDTLPAAAIPPTGQGNGQELPVEVEAPKVIQGPAPAAETPSPGREPEGSGSCPAAVTEAEEPSSEHSRVTAETEGRAEVAAALAEALAPSAPPADRRFLDALDEQRRMAVGRLSELVLALGGKSALLSKLLEHFDTGRLRSLLGCLSSYDLIQGGSDSSASAGDKEQTELRTFRTWLANLPVADQQLLDGLDRALRTVPAFQALADLSEKVDAHATEVYAADIMERDVGAVRDANHDKAFVAASLDTRTVVDLLRGMLCIRRSSARQRLEAFEARE